MVETRPRHVVTRRLIEKAARELSSENARELDGLMGPASPSNHRLNSLVQSLAWHTQRATPADRLAEMERELARLSEKADKGSPETELYTWLSKQIGQGKQIAELEGIRGLRAGEADALADEFDLLFAEQILGALLLLARSKALRNEIVESGGKVVWR